METRCKTTVSKCQAATAMLISRVHADVFKEEQLTASLAAANLKIRTDGGREKMIVFEDRLRVMDLKKQCVFMAAIANCAWLTLALAGWLRTCSWPRSCKRCTKAISYWMCVFHTFAASEIGRAHV